MASEDEIADIYDDYLEGRDTLYLISQLLVAFREGRVGTGNPCIGKQERRQLINMIKSIDFTGKFDCGFYDLWKSISTNDGCG